MNPDPMYKHIGAVIKARRKTLKLTQENLAGWLEISRGSLANIETGRQGILVHQLYKIAAVLELRPIDLLPPFSGDNGKVEHANLPLPEDLKGQQREQVALFYEQIDTSKSKDSEVSSVKSKKR